MPDQERSHRPNKAVLWPLEQFDDTGQPVVGNPEEINVRWEASAESEGEATAVQAMVTVDRKIDIGSAMWLGELSEWSGVRPENGENVMQVVKYDGTPDVKGRATLRVVGVVRFRNSWPTTEDGAILMDPEQSSMSVSDLEALADNLEEIAISVQLIDNDGDAIVGRDVSLSLSSNTGITLNNSPQTTDSDGEAVLRLRANAAATPTVTIRTGEDGDIFARLSLTFTAP